MGNIIIGIVFIIGGISGTMALRGTHSPIALAVVGFVLVIFGVSQMSSAKNKPKTARRTRRGTGRMVAGQPRQRGVGRR